MCMYDLMYEKKAFVRRVQKAPGSKDAFLETEW
jgi:hypothetical protein